MLIVHIACTPLAGAPIKIAEALNKYTDFKARLINLDSNAYGNRTFPEDLIWEKDKEECLSLISRADILHFHHFMDINSDNNPFKINFLKYAQKAKIIRQFHTNIKQLAVWHNTSTLTFINDEYPKLTIPHCAERSLPDAYIVPNILPIQDKILLPKTVDKNIVSVFFSASSQASMWDLRWDTKGLPEVVKKFRQLNKKYNFNFEIITNLPYQECMKIKQSSDIVIGDTTSGSYHLTDLEALCHGKPTFSYLDARSQMVLQNLVQCDSLPFINTRLEEIDLPFYEILKNKELRTEIGYFSRNWIEKYYNDKDLVKFFVDAYKKVLNEQPLSRQEYLLYKNAKTFLFNDLYDMQWQARKENYIKKEKFKINTSKEKIKEFIQHIFSARNSYTNNVKRKTIKFLGIKITFKIKTKSLKTVQDSNKLNILFFVSGGFGDFLINANFIYHFCKYLNKGNNKDILIDIAAPLIQKTNFKATFKDGHNFINKCYIEKPQKNYDLEMRLHSHLEINFCDEEKIKKLHFALYQLIKNYQKYNDAHNFFAYYHTNAYHIALANKKNRLQLADITGKLGIKKVFDFPLLYPDNENEILEKFNLKDKIFITFNRGVDKNNTYAESTKMWQLEHMNTLAKLLKDKYPHIILVQLGADIKKCREIENMNISLIGQTNLDDIKVLIKNSILHIDCEGGFAHLRNALKASNPAIVIFGPTNPDLYGYETNINIKNNKACPICCDWITSSWQAKCLRGEKIPPCTNSITADEVFKFADKYLKEHYFDNKEKINGKSL